ncbi:MAG TPA: FAD-dependent oxidoreductase [Gammaproteobacteria bacterium]|nr:FAD-dependent oxidoreductase [Gammaproteobacteria bacterium]
MRPEFDICVIGGGAGGLVVAAGGASLGAKVALVEHQALGGDCLHYGCVPSKALLHAAKVAHTVRRARDFGIEAPPPAVDLAQVMARVSRVVQSIAVNDSPERFGAMGVEVIFGEGRFADRRTLRVGDRDITARHFVIATGSRPAVPPVEGLAHSPYLTNETVFSLREPVPRLIVLGGGPVGVEMAQAFARLGSEVQIVHRRARLLPADDPDLAEVVARRLAAEGIGLHLDSRVTRVAGRAGGIRVTLAAGGEEQHLEGSHLLVAAGRRANTEALNLEAAGVAVDGARGIVTDRRLRTANPAVYACGDVVGPYRFTHMAEHHGGVILRNVIFRLPARVRERAIPWCTFTDPELARVGLSESEARRQGLDHRVYTFPFSDIDRAHAEGATEGFAKIVTDPRGRLLGAALVGPQAGELIHEYCLAVSKGMKAADLSGVIHIYPTLAQINRKVADVRMKAGLTPTRKKWIQRLFRLRGG